MEPQQKYHLGMISNMKLLGDTGKYLDWVIKLNPKTNKEQQPFCFLQEAAAIQMELVRRQLEADERLTSGDDIQVALVADLQELQKQEAENLLEEIENKVQSCFWKFKVSRLEQTDY